MAATNPYLEEGFGAWRKQKGRGNRGPFRTGMRNPSALRQAQSFSLVEEEADSHVHIPFAKTAALSFWTMSRLFAISALARDTRLFTVPTFTFRILAASA